MDKIEKKDGEMKEKMIEVKRVYKKVKGGSIL